VSLSLSPKCFAHAGLLRSTDGVRWINPWPPISPISVTASLVSSTPAIIDGEEDEDDEAGHDGFHVLDPDEVTGGTFFSSFQSRSFFPSILVLTRYVTVHSW